MKILLIEDEELTARKMQRMLADVQSDAQLLATIGSVEESVEWLQSHQSPDLILMDIELADGQSFEIFNQVTVSCPVIFTTAYDEYAIKAFRVNSIDYLLKPVKEEDLRRALNKLQQLKQVLITQPDFLQTSLVNLLAQLSAPLPQATQVTNYRDRFMIKQGQRLFAIETDEIAYFFTRNKISFIKTHDNREYMVDYTLDELDKMLNSKRFFRLNRQIIAELRAIEKVHLYFNNKLKIQLRPAFEEEVLVSRIKASDFKIWLGE
jgi:two-component system LytT family response regulator